jgi:hypothetical protein
MGAYVIILPDKMYINTADTEDRGSIEARYESEEDVTFTLCRVDGSAYDVQYTQSEAPSNPTNTTLWVDTSTVPNVLKQWSESSNMWVSIATTYVKIQCTGIGKNFSVYDGITISGLKELESQVKALDGSAIIYDKKDDYIVIVGILDKAETVSSKVTIARTMPVMDFIIEAGNRLWGCRYGLDDHGEFVNRLYASKLGDFKNWNCYMGVSTDSYYANVGSDGYFTGAVTHLGAALFFKEHCLHKVFGGQPSEFVVQDTACRGVQSGCEMSTAIVNEVLYYKARNAVCAYDGSLPVEVSYALGGEKYYEAVAGAHGNKYYIDMKTADGVYHLFVYDTAKRMWHKEDNLQADCFCSFGNELYCIDHDTKSIVTMLGSAISGMILSRYIFSWIDLNGAAMARTVHMLSGYWSFVLISLHLGLHWVMIVGMVSKKIPKHKRSLAWIARTAAMLVACYGGYAMMKRQVLEYLFGITRFAFIDGNEPVVLFLVDYIAMMGLYTFVGHYLSMALKMTPKGRKG